MRAKTIYEKTKKDLDTLVNAIRTKGTPGHLDTPQKLLSVNSAHPFEDDLEVLDAQTAGAEIAGIYTLCQVKPIRKNDMQLTCVETEDNMTKRLHECLKPIGMDVLTEIAELSIEQEKVTIDLIKKFMKGEISEKEANREWHSRLKSSLRDEKEILNYFKKYRDSNCGIPNKLLTKVETRHGRLIEIEEKETRPVRL